MLAKFSFSEIRQKQRRNYLCHGSCAMSETVKQPGVVALACGGPLGLGVFMGYFRVMVGLAFT